MLDVNTALYHLSSIVKSVQGVMQETTNQVSHNDSSQLQARRLFMLDTHMSQTKMLVDFIL